VECAFSKCYLKFKVLLLVIRVVLGFMLANMCERMCLITKGSCSGRREAHAYIECNWTTGAALLRMCTACKWSFNFHKGFKYKWFMLQNQYKRSLKYIFTLFPFAPPLLHNDIQSSDLFIHINTWNTLLLLLLKLQEIVCS